MNIKAEIPFKKKGSFQTETKLVPYGHTLAFFHKLDEAGQATHQGFIDSLNGGGLWRHGGVV